MHKTKIKIKLNKNIDKKLKNRMKNKDMSIAQKAVHSIQTKYRKSIWHKFTAALKEYNLIEENDKIACCISGGKDSFLLAICLKMLQKYSDFPFSLEFISMNPGYTKEDFDGIINNAKMLEIPLVTFESDIFSIVDSLQDKPCYLCARMRRGHLYSKAQELNCNKIALAHHFDDVIETTLMSLLHAGEFKTMMPSLPSQNFAGLSLIRPFYMVREKDIISWRDYNNLSFIKCGCTVTKSICDTGEGSKRYEVKRLLENLRKESPLIDMNIFRSTQNVNLTTILGYRFSIDDEIHGFLEDIKNGKRT